MAIGELLPVLQKDLLLSPGVVLFLWPFFRGGGGRPVFPATHCAQNAMSLLEKAVVSRPANVKKNQPVRLNYAGMTSGALQIKMSSGGGGMQRKNNR